MVNFNAGKRENCELMCGCELLTFIYLRQSWCTVIRYLYVKQHIKLNVHISFLAVPASCKNNSSDRACIREEGVSGGNSWRWQTLLLSQSSLSRRKLEFSTPPSLLPSRASPSLHPKLCLTHLHYEYIIVFFLHLVLLLWVAEPCIIYLFYFVSFYNG